MMKYLFKQTTTIMEIIEKEFATDEEAKAFIRNVEAMDPEWRCNDMDHDFSAWNAQGEQVGE